MGQARTRWVPHVTTCQPNSARRQGQTSVPPLEMSYMDPPSNRAMIYISCREQSLRCCSFLNDHSLSHLPSSLLPMHGILHPRAMGSFNGGFVLYRYSFRFLIDTVLVHVSYSRTRLEHVNFIRISLPAGIGHVPNEKP